MQTRLSRFGLALAIVGLVYVGVTITFSLWLHNPFVRPVLPQLFATIAFGALWLSLRGRPRSSRQVRLIEIVTMLVGTSGFSAMAISLPLVAQPESIVRGALTYVLLAYAAYVPSTARRTLILASLIGVPLLACVFVASLKFDPAIHAPRGLEWPKQSSEQIAVSMAVYSLVWWAVAVGLATGTSRVIYGLRRTVRDVKRLGQYTLEEKLGEGGMGIVYRASHAMLRRPTAVKLLLPDRTGDGALARFEREVQRTAMLTHPNTVTVFDYGRTAEGVFYYAMELLDGATLAEIVEVDGPQSEERVIHIIAQMAGALAEAHAAGLIHRDIKPANVILVSRGGIADRVKVVDFGLVKDVARDGRGQAFDATLTHAGAISGTPLYMAPETITDPDRVDARSDLYAVGAVAYWLLTGTHVFGGRSVVEVCSHHLHSQPVRPSSRLGRAIQQDLEAVVLACLAKSADDRPASANELRDRLRACGAAGSWTEARAAAWWSGRAPALAARKGGTAREAPQPHGELTITRLPDTGSGAWASR